MITFILLLLLLIGFAFSVKVCNGDVLEPLPLSFAAFSITATIAFCRNGFYGLDISWIALLVIITSLCFYALGYLGVKMFFTHTTLNDFRSYEILPFPKKAIGRLILLLAIVVLYGAYKEMYRLAMTVNANVSQEDMMMAARNANMFKEVQRNFVVVIGNFLVSSLGYFYTYILIVHKNNSQKFSRYIRSNIVATSIVVISLLAGALGTGRTFLIKYICFVLVVTHYHVYLRDKIKRYSTKQVISLIKKLILAVAVFFIFFQLLGLTTGKTQKSSTTDLLYAYSGAALLAFSNSIDDYAPDDRFWGEECFYGLYGFMNAFGIKVPNEILHLPFTYFPDGSSTNIYMSLRSYIYDFGFIGLFITQFFIGGASALAYVLLRRFSRYPVYLFIYAILIYGTAMQGIEEITLRNFMGITNCFQIIFFWLLCWVDTKTFVIGKLRLRLHG